MANRVGRVKNPVSRHAGDTAMMLIHRIDNILGEYDYFDRQAVYERLLEHCMEKLKPNE